jgi:glycopeptide antibiotics resistance protein
MIPIALLHFVTGSNYKGPHPEFVNGYLLDILVPFGFYFLLCLQDVVFSFLRPWFVKGLPVFAVGFSVEVAQFYGVPIFGRTFDPLDFVMYGIGIILAAILDTTVLPRIFDFWAPKAKGSTSEIREEMRQSRGASQW